MSRPSCRKAPVPNLPPSLPPSSTEDFTSLQKQILKEIRELAPQNGQPADRFEIKRKVLSFYPNLTKKQLKMLMNEALGKQKSTVKGKGTLHTANIPSKSQKDSHLGKTAPTTSTTKQVQQKQKSKVAVLTSSKIPDSGVQKSNAESSNYQNSSPAPSTKDLDTPGVLIPGNVEGNTGVSTQVAPMPNSKILALNKFLEELTTTDINISENVNGGPSTLELQFRLIHIEDGEENDEPPTHKLRSAVLFSGNILDYHGSGLLPQYGLLGSTYWPPSVKPADSRLFLNTNVPFSAFICGVQGSGKSHTTACIIENCIIQSPILGILQKPLSALVFNFAECSSRSNFRPSEVAFLASPNKQHPSRLGAKKINVLVSPSNYHSLKESYSSIPRVVVQPFKLHPQDLNISVMLTLMSVNNAQTAPLYLGTVTMILRDMAAESANSFDYPEFRRRLDQAGLGGTQMDFLNQRLNLLESFIDLEGRTARPTFSAGEITIIDLSCPFLDASTACVLFKIGMEIYLNSDTTIGKLIVLDEAHKYMTNTLASRALTESLLSVIRQQRHYGARVLVSTQEPTISPHLIDLCSLTVIHRFSSPQWMSILKKHVSVSDDDKEKEDGEQGNLFNKILRLKTGEALIFAPTAILETSAVSGKMAGRGEMDWKTAADELIRVRIRKRVTWDGGASIVCV